MIRKGNIGDFCRCEAFVCDLDGTLYLENTPIPLASQFLQALKVSQRAFYYFTNNTSRSRRSYLEKLHKMGFPAESRHLITAADCTDSYLRRNSLFPRIYLVGNADLNEDFAQRGYICLSEQEAMGPHPPCAVVLGFDTEITYAKIRTCYNLILKDIPYIATHADRLCPLANNQFMPDVGSFISMFETATGRLPVVMGKPNSEAVRAICERAQKNPDRMAFIGDRLYTDMRMAKQNGLLGVLVLSGETKEDMLAPSPDQPDIVVDSVADLIEYL
jgi:4-nitrophenyl phosphatase